MFNKPGSGRGGGSSSGIWTSKTHSQASQAPDVMSKSFESPMNENVDPLSPMSLPASPLDDSKDLFLQFLCEQDEARGADFAADYSEEDGARGIQRKACNQDKKPTKTKSQDELSKDLSPVPPVQRREVPARLLDTSLMTPLAPPPTTVFGESIQQPNRPSFGEANTTWNALGASGGTSNVGSAAGSEKEQSCLNRDSLDSGSLWLTQSEDLTRVPSPEFLSLCLRMDKVEAHCQALTLENTILRTQISECMGFRAKIHALTYRLDNMSLQSLSPSPYSTRIPSPSEPKYYENPDYVRQYAVPPTATELDKAKYSRIQGAGAAAAPAPGPGLLMVAPHPSIAPIPTTAVLGRSTQSVSYQRPPQVGPPPIQKSSSKITYWNPPEQSHKNRAVPPPSQPSMAAGLYRWLFVSKFKRTVTEKVISDYMAHRLSSHRRPLICIGLTRPDEPPTKPASFRVKLYSSDMEEALTPGFWADGIQVKEYKFHKSKKEHSKTSSGRWN